MTNPTDAADLELIEPNRNPFAVAYEATRARITALVAQVDPAEAEAIVPACPDWTVQQLCAHIAGVCTDLVAGNRPGADLQGWIDGQVAARADRSPIELIAEWNAHGAAFEALITERPKGYAGLLYDVVAHEHDLRATLGQPGERTTDGVRLSLDVVISALQRDLTAHALPAARFLSDDGDWFVGDGDPELVLDLRGRPDGTWELLRALGSRRSAGQLATLPFTGDLDRYLPALAHQPLPVADLVE